jgi:hypothetical protein
MNLGPTNTNPEVMTTVRRLRTRKNIHHPRLAPDLIPYMFQMEENIANANPAVAKIP